MNALAGVIRLMILQPAVGTEHILQQQNEREWKANNECERVNVQIVLNRFLHMPIWKPDIHIAAQNLYHYGRFPFPLVLSNFVFFVFHFDRIQFTSNSRNAGRTRP
jgi:hypothetical protein